MNYLKISMGIFGGGKKVDDNRPDMQKDVRDVKTAVDNTPSMKTSYVKEDSEGDDWRKKFEEWVNPRAEGSDDQAEPQVEPTGADDNFEIKPMTEEPIQFEEMSQPIYAPLFVKIDKYRNIVVTVNTLKNTIILLKNSFTVLNDLDKTRSQTMTMIRDTLERVEKRLNSLDNDLVRPSGFSAHAPDEVFQEVHTVQSTLSDLKGQIQQLKGELQKM